MQVTYKVFTFICFHSFIWKWWIAVRPVHLLRIFNINFNNMSYVAIFIIMFDEIFIKIDCILLPLKSIYRYFLWHCPSIQLFYIRVHEIWWDFVWVMIFQVFSSICCWLLHEEQDIFHLCNLSLPLVTSTSLNSSKFWFKLFSFFFQFSFIHNDKPKNTNSAVIHKQALYHNTTISLV